ncbi:MAG: hypothetical protein BM557_05820 [Flavobacterium sp. MedPE-SWcel]|nr:MAG: hypothetical protein BM557_05820 [Flavobacterium sp. MedPE-SWcel]
MFSHYMKVPIVFTLDMFKVMLLSFIGLLGLAIIIFIIVKWLNKKLPWSPKTALLRTVVDLFIFTIVTSVWITGYNIIDTYIRFGGVPDFDSIVLRCTMGVIINFFLIPFIELSVLLNTKYISELETKKLELENQKIKYEVLKNQINPHFLFNSLSVLNSLISIEPSKAKEFTSSFSKVLRHVLDFKYTDSITLKEEKEFLEHYVYLLKTRFGDALNVKVTIPDEFMNKIILPMVLQLLIENVIKHNEVSDNHPMTVVVEANDKGIFVHNKVQLKSSVSSWGIGLDNIKKRYESLGYTVEVKKEQEMFNIFIPYIQ